MSIIRATNQCWELSTQPKSKGGETFGEEAEDMSPGAAGEAQTGERDAAGEVHTDIPVLRTRRYEGRR